MSSRAACARAGDRVRITAQLNDVATGSHIWAERYDRNLADVFAVQDEITEAIVAAIEPQLYAAENFRAQRKPPDSMDAWDLVMRALSHYWRVTRQDNMVAQALLEKAIAIDPNYGQALGVLATSYIFSAHMGWADMPTVVPVAERAALAAIEPTAKTRGRTCTGQSTYSPAASTTCSPNSNWRCDSIRTSHLRRAFMASLCLLRTMARRRLGRAPCAATQPARSVFGDLLWHRGLCAVHRPQL